MELRPATPDDVELLQHWDEQPHVIASDPNGDWDWDTELQRSHDWRDLLIAEEDGRPVGFVQIIDPAREESHYGGDVPSGLRAIDIWIGEESDLGLGFRFVERRRFGTDDCFVYRLECSDFGECS
jgi:aminoglycoside 6'-N-acetyltransferase